MMKLAPIGLAFALLSGCTDHSVTDDNGGDTGSGSNEPQPEPQMDANGTYRLTSTFDIATNMPGTSGSILNGLIDATDDQDDPMSWLVDQMLAQMQPGTLKDVLVAAKPFVIGYLNDRVTSLAPDLVATLKALGTRLEDLAKHLGVNEKLEVTSVDQTYISRITADGVRFLVNGTEKDYLFTDNNIDNVIVNDVLVTLDRGQAKFHIGEHTLPLPYGRILRLALDSAIIPVLDPNATSLTGLLDNLVDCQGVGQSVANALGIGGSALFASACVAGLGMVADTVYDQIAATDEKLGMHLVGQARYSDTNADYKIDEIKLGNWTGTMNMGGVDATLAQPAQFVGKRL